MATRALSAGLQKADAALSDVVAEVRAIATDRQLLDPKLVEAAVRAWSENSIRAFLSDIRLWDSWCRRSGVRATDATGDAVAAYVRALSGLDKESPAAQRTEKRAVATIARYLVSIGWADPMAGKGIRPPSRWCALN